MCLKGRSWPKPPFKTSTSLADYSGTHKGTRRHLIDLAIVRRDRLFSRRRGQASSNGIGLGESIIQRANALAPFIHYPTCGKG